jgi:hypothetical protein
MRNRCQYIQNQNNCFSAINDLKKTNSVYDWLKRHESLYGQIIIKPEGLPAIIDFNFGDESFIGIRKFGRLYETIKDIFE